MSQDSLSSEKHQEEKKTTPDVHSLVEQGEFLLLYSEMLGSLKQTVLFLTSVGADPQTTELLSSTKYSLVKTILHLRLRELILASLSLSAMLQQCSVADMVSTLIEELLSKELDQQQADQS